MASEYGYGELEDKIINLFRSGTPDFEAAEELIRQGADLNATSRAPDDNILSEILVGYWDTIQDDSNENCHCCEKGNCNNCEHNQNPFLGESMCNVIRFFLNHGFDVTKQDGCFGAQCLYALTLSTFDRSMIEAAKILFDAGARNRPISLLADDEGETPLSFIDTEGMFQRTCQNDYALSNIFEAVYQMFEAIDNGRPYNGIDSFEAAAGKKILRVMAESNGGLPVFYPLDLPDFKEDNCFNRALYFVYDGGVLVLNQHADFWTDTHMPEAELIDVSAHFGGIVGGTIRQFTFGHREVIKYTTHYCQPVIFFEMDSGRRLKFSINFGEVEQNNHAGYFELDPHTPER